MGRFLSDVRHSLRVLRKNPGFTVIAILALALGIGANTAIFSVVDRVLLRPLPFPESERIMRVQRHFPNGDGASVSGRSFNAQEDLPNAGKFTVVTFNLWRSRLGGDRDIVGRTIRLNAEPYLVVGAALRGLIRCWPCARSKRHCGSTSRFLTSPVGYDGFLLEWEQKIRSCCLRQRRRSAARIASFDVPPSNLRLLRSKCGNLGTRQEPP